MSAEDREMREYVWPRSFDEKVDLGRVSLDMVKSWLTQKVTELTGSEDEILIEYIMNNLLEELDPKTLTVRLRGFLQENTYDFVASLWNLLLQKDSVPQELKDAQKKELETQRLEAEKIKRELAALEARPGLRG
ncbi:PWI domain protein [Gregarina niphandrodes]|uniref:PWI domain protein n=1 Tax=Gregarina niphandrodes TaxID=110365 RepID=A0A023B3K2_GRENI|nr:PWI domain protein [Gregarina niphandrodes]EZG55577.1 PWI domain protein [Gregarina niphandrodes]|eukprot:XP_011131490.1 PWI domain protein [Gregarina niphandrodes]